MNKILVLLVCLSISILKAQDATTASPKIVSKLKIGNAAEFEDYTIKFIKVIEDSRCPSDTSCMWAGEIKIKIELYQGNALVSQETLIFGTDAIHPENAKKLFEVDQKTVFAYNVSPYPVSTSKINQNEYYLELLIQ